MTQVLTADTLIVGAGVIGSSVAMHLAAQSRAAAGDIRVIDFDLEGALSSSELNAGGVRATWNQPINIQMSKLSIDYFAENAEAVGYRPVGYLWLHPEDRLKVALAARDRQLAMGWEVEAWDVAELRRRVPFIDKTDGIAGAVFAPKDGLVNPNLMKNHFREVARSHGAVFDDRVLLKGAEMLPDGSIELVAERYPARISAEDRLRILSGQAAVDARPETIRYRAQRVVNAAGPWAGSVARMLGYPSPVFAVRRQVCIFDCRDVDLTPYGMVVDTSGVYFHPEATNGLAGFASHDEPHGINYNYDGESFFMEVIWPALYERSTAFEKLKHLTGWAGLYEVSPDESAVIGEASGVAKTGRVFEAHSFSGHGVMHSYAAGLALAEKILKGKYLTIDVSALSGARFAEGRSVRETLVI